VLTLHSPRQPTSDIGGAQAAYEHARAQLLAAEHAYARALLLLQRAQVSGGAPPFAGYERHFLCGHAGMERTEDGGGQVLTLCPVCRIGLAGASATFSEQRRLLVREPQPDDPD
jgi:hypothetical protein